MSRRARRNLDREYVRTFSPRNRISPAVGSMSRRMHLPVVVLPHPDSPTRPNVSPSFTEKLTSSTARVTVARPRKPGRLTYSFVRLRTSRSVIASGTNRKVRTASPRPAHRRGGNNGLPGRFRERLRRRRTHSDPTAGVRAAEGYLRKD